MFETKNRFNPKLVTSGTFFGYTFKFPDPKVAFFSDEVLSLPKNQHEILGPIKNRRLKFILNPVKKM